MFEDSLVESTGKLRSGRTKYTTLLSFLLQCAIIGVLVLIPLIYTEALPAKAMLTTLVAPPPPPPPPPPPAAEIKVVKKITTEIVDGALRTPTKIPDKIKKIVEEEAPPPQQPGIIGGIGGAVGGSTGGVLGGVLAAANAAPPKVEVKKLRVSAGVVEANKLSAPKPVYPPLAKQAHIQGTVVLAATISKAGSIENLQVVSGHPMLRQAALDAVRNWKYKPTYLNGEPVEVETTINVNFSLGG
jgi:periplasmic protein TonB